MNRKIVKSFLALGILFSSFSYGNFEEGIRYNIVNNSPFDKAKLKYEYMTEYSKNGLKGENKEEKILNLTQKIYGEENNIVFNINDFDVFAVLEEDVYGLSFSFETENIDLNRVLEFKVSYTKEEEDYYLLEGDIYFQNGVDFTRWQEPSFTIYNNEGKVKYKDFKDGKWIFKTYVNENDIDEGIDSLKITVNGVDINGNKVQVINNYL